jgi:chromate transport protein ChrA
LIVVAAIPLALVLVTFLLGLLAFFESLVYVALAVLIGWTILRKTPRIKDETEEEQRKACESSQGR